jgi:hypothetical protein
MTIMKQDLFSPWLNFASIYSVVLNHQSDDIALFFTKAVTKNLVRDRWLPREHCLPTAYAVHNPCV